MNILLYGDDNALLRKKLTGLKWQFLEKHPDGEIVTLHGDDLPDVEAFADFFITDSLFGAKKLFVLKHFADVVADKHGAKLIPWLISGAENHTVIYYEEDNLDVLKAEHFQHLVKDTLLDEKFIFCCRKGRSLPASLPLTSEQRIYLDQVYSQNSALAEQELTKAQLLYRSGHPELINLVFNDYQLSLSVFPFIDSVFARHAAKATLLVRDLLAQGENELMLLTMLINHVKKILFVLDAERKRADVNGLLKKMRVHAFVAKKLLQQKNGFTWETAQIWLAKLLEIDLLAKQGKVDAKVALTQFCVSIGT